jgi:pullulanase/glycogen debranching enzyme
MTGSRWRMWCYADKHNEANGEDNRDGHGENFSDNLGVEGPSRRPRDPRRRASGGATCWPRSCSARARR